MMFNGDGSEDLNIASLISYKFFDFSTGFVKLVVIFFTSAFYFIFIAVFSGSHINDRSHRPSKVYCFIHLLVC